jgi:hypothetical protein
MNTTISTSKVMENEYPQLDDASAGIEASMDKFLRH